MIGLEVWISTMPVPETDAEARGPPAGARGGGPAVEPIGEETRMKAIRIHAPGGPEAMRLEELPEPVAGPGEAVVRIEAIGVNFIDVYQRTGLYTIDLPATLGLEAAGVVTAVGPEVKDIRSGDRVAWAMAPGAYATAAAVPAAKLVPVPEHVPARQAAAILLQGMTAHYLATSTYPLGPGDTCLVHAAAGGVGLLLCQIARQRGARAATVSSAARRTSRSRRCRHRHPLRPGRFQRRWGN
jgi:NADPH2:quinone reductase